MTSPDLPARPEPATAMDVFDRYCLTVVHSGELPDDPDEWPCPVACHDRRPWCECWCHGMDNADAS